MGYVWLETTKFITYGNQNNAFCIVLKEEEKDFISKKLFESSLLNIVIYKILVKLIHFPCKISH